MKLSQPLTAFLLVLSFVALAEGNDQIRIVVGADAPSLERFAATELAAQFERLFVAEVVVGESSENQPSTHHVLIGSPATNSLIENDHADQWPELTDQGICIRSIADLDQPTLIVGGGSPVATMWAAYELGHHFGIRYMLHGDIFPPQTIPLELVGLDLVLEPQFRHPRLGGAGDVRLRPGRLDIGRTSPRAGPAGQIEIQPRGPRVRSLATVRTLRISWRAEVIVQVVARWSVSRGWDTVGRDVFQGAEEFTHPDFEGRQTYAEVTEAGTTLARGIIDKAHQLGMTAAISISPLEFPIEFDEVLPRRCSART